MRSLLLPSKSNYLTSRQHFQKPLLYGGNRVRRRKESPSRVHQRMQRLIYPTNQMLFLKSDRSLCSTNIYAVVASLVKRQRRESLRSITARETAEPQGALYHLRMLFHCSLQRLGSHIGHVADQVSHSWLSCLLNYTIC